MGFEAINYFVSLAIFVVMALTMVGSVAMYVVYKVREAKPRGKVEKLPTLLVEKTTQELPTERPRKKIKFG